MENRHLSWRYIHSFNGTWLPGFGQGTCVRTRWPHRVPGDCPGNSWEVTDVVVVFDGLAW